MKKVTMRIMARNLANAWDITVYVFPVINNNFEYWGMTDDEEKLEEWQKLFVEKISPNGGRADNHYAGIITLYGDTEWVVASFPHTTLKSIMETYDEYVDNQTIWFGAGTRLELKLWPRRPDNFATLAQYETH